MPQRIITMSYRHKTLQKTKKEITVLMRNVLQAVYHFERYKEKYFGITYELYYALTLIHSTKKQTITGLANAMEIPLHKATRIVQRLHAKRLVERKTSLKDKRVVYVVPTQKGKQCLNDIEDFCFSTVMNNVASMSEDELSLLIHAAANIPEILRIQKFQSKEVKYAK